MLYYQEIIITVRMITLQRLNACGKHIVIIVGVSISVIINCLKCFSVDVVCFFSFCMFQEPHKSKKVQHSNAKNAVLFEAINLIVHLQRSVILWIVQLRIWNIVVCVLQCSVIQEQQLQYVYGLVLSSCTCQWLLIRMVLWSFNISPASVKQVPSGYLHLC